MCLVIRSRKVVHVFSLTLQCDSKLTVGLCTAAERSVLIVYAHQSNKSFNAAARDAAMEVLQSQGCRVTVSDLYAMGFRACATADDIIGTATQPFKHTFRTPRGSLLIMW